MLSFNVNVLLDSFSISKLGLGKINSYAIARLKLGYENVKMDITKTGNCKLLGLGVV